LGIRWRLMLWHGLVLSVVLIGFGVALYLLMERHLLELTDTMLKEEITELESAVSDAKNRRELVDVLAQRFPPQDGYELEVRTLDGTPLFRSIGIGSKGLPYARALQVKSAKLQLESIYLDGSKPVRLACRVVSGPAGPLMIQVAITLAAHLRATKELWTVLLTIEPVALAMALGGGYWLARKALAPVNRMAREAAEITVTRLNRRLIEPQADDELSNLARTFNAMIARLEHSFQLVERFTADAAHELRTPLAAMRTEAEVALRAPRLADRDSRVLENLLEEIERLTRLVSHLLFLSRETGATDKAKGELLQLSGVVHDVGEHMQVMAKEKGIELILELGHECVIRGHADRLRQLFFNLLDNSIKYTLPGGRVTISSEVSGQRVNIRVTDTGIGIAAEHLPFVFDRFYRVDPARSPESDGCGLGLAICRSIAQAHSGKLTIESQLGSGTCVTLMLPVVDRVDVIHGQAGDQIPRTHPMDVEWHRERSALQAHKLLEPQSQSAGLDH
jgi:heavy metal sensor kinase